MPTEKHGLHGSSPTRRGSILRFVYATRACLLFVPVIFVGPLLFYAVLYWWFVPTSMRLEAPIALPSTTTKIVASIFVIPALLLARVTAEALASSLPLQSVTSLHRIAAPLTFALGIPTSVFTLWLFAPVVGLSPPSPTVVSITFAGLVAVAVMNTVKGGLAVFARVDDDARAPEQFVGPSASQLVTADPRPPIVYLRSFGSEREKATTLGRFAYIRSRHGGFYFAARRPSGEEGLATLLRTMLARDYKRKILNSHRSAHDEQMLFQEYFAALGPYIAIKRPGETAETMDLGAAKYLVPDESWQSKVTEMIERAAAVVIEAGDSSGLSWEIQEVVSRVRPESVLLILPRNDADYRDFRVVAASLFPRPMPSELPSARLLMFDADWSPVSINTVSMFLEDPLEPFVQRIWPRTEPSGSNRIHAA